MQNIGSMGLVAAIQLSKSAQSFGFMIRRMGRETQVRMSQKDCGNRARRRALDPRNRLTSIPLKPCRGCRKELGEDLVTRHRRRAWAGPKRSHRYLGSCFPTAGPSVSYRNRAFTNANALFSLVRNVNPSFREKHMPTSCISSGMA